MVRLEVLEPAAWIAGGDAAADVRLVETRVVRRDDAERGLVRRDGAALTQGDPRRGARSWLWNDRADTVLRVPLRRIATPGPRPEWNAGGADDGSRSPLLDVRV